MWDKNKGAKTFEASATETRKLLKCVTKHGTYMYFPSVPVALINKIVNYQEVKILN